MSIHWVAGYSDGETLSQYNSDGSENRYADIDRSRLSSFGLFRENDGGLIFGLFLDEGQRLIYRKRTSIRSDGAKVSFYMIGWQMTENSKNIQSISYIHESGSPIFMAGQFREDHPLFYSIVPTEEET